MNSTSIARFILPGLGGTAMVAVYFLGEICMPSIGLQVAVAEIPANIVQAVGGAPGGFFAAMALKKTGLL